MHRLFLYLLLISVYGTASAACFNPDALNTYPSPEQAEIYFDIHRAAKSDQALYKKLLPLLSESKETLVFAPHHAPVQEQYHPALGGFVWSNHLDPKKYDAKKFHGDEATSFSPADATSVYFYEPDGKGGRRICRIEAWRGRGNPQHVDYLPEYKEPSLANWPTLKAMTRNFVPAIAYLYFYDAAGRVTEWRAHESYSTNETAPYAFEKRPRQNTCYIRDSSGRMARFVQSILVGKTCSTLDRTTASYMDYRYDKDGRFAGSVQNMAGNQTTAKPDAAWSMIYRLRPDPTRYIEAEADAWWGLHYVTGIPQIEDVPDRKVPDEKLGAPYRFPEGAPISVMENLPHSIKAHRRIRQGPASGMGTVSEMFPPNGGLTERIFSRNSDGTVFRHERFKNGKPYQVVNDIILLNKKGESYLYDEDLVALDKVLKHPQINVPRSHIRLRVYKVDAAGKHKLVALSWSKALRDDSEFKQLNREEALIDLWQTVKGSKKKKQPEPSEADLHVRFTNPQGKEIWRDWDAFLKATGYVEKISAFFPHGTPPRYQPNPPLRLSAEELGK